MVTYRVAPTTKEKLKFMSLATGRTMSELLEEAIELLYTQNIEIVKEYLRERGEELDA
jgi:predicted DNA-binding protein